MTNHKRSDRQKLRFDSITKHLVTTYGGTNTKYRGADKSLAWQGRTQTNVSVRMREFPSTPCPAKKKNLKTARVSILLKSRLSLTCFRACFIPGRAKDLSAPRVQINMFLNPTHGTLMRLKNNGHWTTRSLLKLIGLYWVFDWWDF